MTLPGKVAVIGASGFIGSRLVEVFHLAGWCEVVPVVRRVSGLSRVARFDLNWRLADACSIDALSSALEGCEAVVHCMVGDPQVITSAAAALLPAAARAGVRRVIYLSTASVHGQNPAPGTNEDSVLSDRQAVEYNNAKVRAERILFRDLKLHPVEFAALRPSIVFGPRDSWISALASGLEGGTAWLINEGLGICNTIYVDNLIHAIRLCLTAPIEAMGHAYLVGDSERVTWGEIYRKTCHALGFDEEGVHRIPVPRFPRRSRWDGLKALRVTPRAQKLIALFPWRLKQAVKRVIQPPDIVVPQNPWELPVPREPVPDRAMTLLQQCNYRLPHDKAQRLLGYEPLVPFDEGFQRTIAWLRWTQS